MAGISVLGMQYWLSGPTSLYGPLVHQDGVSAERLCRRALNWHMFLSLIDINEKHIFDKVEWGLEVQHSILEQKKTITFLQLLCHGKEQNGSLESFVLPLTLKDFLFPIFWQAGASI